MLSITGFDPANDSLEFGTDITGLTQAQLNDISIDGGPTGGAYLAPGGFLVVPEPSTTALAIFGGLGMIALWTARRRRTA